MDSGLGEDVTDLRFELGVTSSAAEAELVQLVVLRMPSTPEAVKKR